MGRITKSRYNIYSADGYHFYSLNVPENFDEEGNLKPANERVYMTYATCPAIMTFDDINTMLISVVVEDYEVIN